MFRKILRYDQGVTYEKHSNHYRAERFEGAAAQEYKASCGQAAYGVEH